MDLLKDRDHQLPGGFQRVHGFFFKDDRDVQGFQLADTEHKRTDPGYRSASSPGRPLTGSSLSYILQLPDRRPGEQDPPEERYGIMTEVWALLRIHA